MSLVNEYGVANSTQTYSTRNSSVPDSPLSVLRGVKSPCLHVNSITKDIRFMMVS
jgi:hypothetical protein